MEALPQTTEVLLGQKPDWATAKNLLADSSFLKKLREFDKDHLTDRTLQMLKAYIRRDEFDPASVDKQSHAARSLCMWCMAINTYSDVAREVTESARAGSYYSVSTYCNSNFTLLAVQIWL